MNKNRLVALYQEKNCNRQTYTVENQHTIGKISFLGFVCKLTIITALLLLTFSSWAFALENLSSTDKNSTQFTFTDVKGSDSEKIRDYSGKTVFWQGELAELNRNDAYFEYFIKLSNGDKVRVLSGMGIREKIGDYVEIKGNIFIRDGKFSHLVLEDIKVTPRPAKNIQEYNTLPGLYPMDISDEEIYKRILAWINYYNPGVSDYNASFIANRIVYYCKKYRTDPFLMTALISAESAFNMNALSCAGAIGLGQLMPGTAQALGVNPYDPEQNIDGSVRYLRDQLSRWSSRSDFVSLALASYNAGPGAVEQYGGIPPYQETQDYVYIVSRLYASIKR